MNKRVVHSLIHGSQLSHDFGLRFTIESLCFSLIIVRSTPVLLNLFELRHTYFIYNFQGTPVKGDFKLNITAMSNKCNIVVNNGVEE